MIRFKTTAPLVAVGLFLVIYLVSKMDNSAQAKKERALFPAQLIRSETGVGASGASGH